MRYITHIRLAGGTGHEHITHFAWSDVGLGKTGSDSRADMVQWVKNGGDARVQSKPVDVPVVVVNANPPYLRTWANNTYTDNLLSLPRF